jgi:hypothetical protein
MNNSNVLQLRMEARSLTHFQEKHVIKKKNAFAFCFYGVQGTALVFDSLAVLGYVVL